MPTFSYLRVSGKSQIEGDGFPRQRQAIEAHAALNDCPVDREFVEEGVTGVAQWHERPAFNAMVAAALDSDSPVTIIVENLTRLAREYVVQDAILVFLASKGVTLVSADTGEDITAAISSDPMKKAIIQMQAVFSELEKSSIVRKLRIARERKREQTGRCEGRKPYGHFPGEQEVVDRIVGLRSAGHTFQSIADALNAAGSVSRFGKPWQMATVAKIASRHTETPDELVPFQ